jgi:hypothetical protein
MSSRRAVLGSIAGLSATLAGCSALGGTSTADPADHVPGEWYGDRDPVRATGERLETTCESGPEADCRGHAEAATMDLLSTRLDSTKQLEASDLSKMADGDDRLLVSRYVLLDRAGEVVRAPEVSFEALRTAAPRTVVATTAYEDHTYTARLAVFVRDAIEQLT